jgi:hypothetical protein
VFAAIKIIGAFMLACVSVTAAIVESGHPVLFCCLCAAFIVGAVGAEVFRSYRNQMVRSAQN